MATPERVPFRLTQNLVDGLGVTGVEGVLEAPPLFCVIESVPCLSQASSG
jgi:phosphatidylinositol kinase/protein kinase (PI-3  family)